MRLEIIVEWLKAVTTGENPGSVPGTHIRWFSTVCGSNSMGSYALWLLYAYGAHKLIQVYTHTHR